MNPYDFPGRHDRTQPAGQTRPRGPPPDVPRGVGVRGGTTRRAHRGCISARPASSMVDLVTAAAGVTPGGSPLRTVIACSKPLLAVNFKLKVMLRAAADDQAEEPHLVRLDQLEQAVSQNQPDLVVIVLSPDPEGGLAVLRRLRGASPGRILVVGKADDSKFILRALHEGADHFLDEDDLETQLEAVLPRICNRDDSNPRAGRLIALLGAGGGSGLSTLAVNVAAVLARDYERCALIDLKPGVGDLASLLDLKPAHTLADLCRNADRLDDDMFESALAAHSSGVHLLA